MRTSIGLIRASSLDALTRSFIPFGAALIIFRFMYHVLSGSDQYLTLVEDDFYYYLVTAANIVNSGVSTFDGFTITNGYHPLWMGIVVTLVKCFGSGAGFFAALSVILAASFVVSASALRLVAARLFPVSIFRPLMVLGGMYVLLRLISAAMEVAVLLPCLGVLLMHLTNEPRADKQRRPLITGVLFSLIILSRLDCILLLVLYVAILGVANRHSPGSCVKHILKLSVGLMPVAAYLMINYVTFGTVVTVSSMAKLQQLSFAVNWPIFHDLWAMPEGRIAALLVPAGLVAFVGSHKRHRSEQHQGLILFILAFPLLYVGVLFLRSSWILFPWYLYSVPFAVTVGGIRLTDWLLSRHSIANARGLMLLQWVAAVLMFGQTAHLISVSTFRFELDPGAPYLHSHAIASFAATHPGRYAMGDKAGLTAYLSTYPILQLEGLCADTMLLGHIRRQDPLPLVLAENRIDYLVVTTYEPLAKDSLGYFVETPNRRQCGTNAPRMSGHFRSEPIFRFCASPEQNDRYLRRRGATATPSYTAIFALRDEAAR